MELRHSPYRSQGSRKAEAAASTAATLQSRNSAQKWTADEDSMLRRGVAEFGAKRWTQIACRVENRSPEECTARWNQLLGFGVVGRQPWSEAEDAEMVQLVKQYGATKWAVIASHLPGRNGKQCRERWHNQVNPAIKKTPWTEEEDALIVRLQAHLGNCWAKITSHLPGRTDNAVKNHWHTLLKPASKRRRASSRGPQPTIRKPKRKKKSPSKAKPRTALKLEQVPSKQTPAFPVYTAVGELSAVAGSAAGCAADPVGSCVDGLSGDSCSTPPVAAVPGAVRGCFSPDAVDNLELSYQAVIDDILDPMGMGSFERSFELSASSFHSASSGLNSVDPTSPAQPPFGLDELLYDSLHDVCGGIGTSGLEPSDLEPSRLVLSAPYGEVARVYHRSTLVTDGMARISYLSLSAPTTNVQSGLDAVKREFPSVETGDFAIPELSSPLDMKP